MYRTFHHLPKLGLAVCIGVIACLSLFAQRHSPGAVSAAQNAPIANDPPVITSTIGIFLPLVAVNYPPPMSDLGDAPDSTNHFTTSMTAYPAGSVIAHFPTVYMDGSTPYGPIHRNPWLKYYLGPAISWESEADTGYDADTFNNIQPVSNLADQDKADDGVAPPTLADCMNTKMDYVVTVPPTAGGLGQTAYVNIWFDYNRNGAWGDVLHCPGGPTQEWAVQNQVISLSGPGSHTFTTPSFIPANPHPDLCLWWRITLSDTPAPAADGSGTAHGYQFGETEDYYLCPPPPWTPTPTPTPTATVTPTPTATVTSTLSCMNPPPPDMAAWWTLDETSDTTAFDIAWPPTNGTHVNGPVPTPAVVAYGLSFDGIDDYVEVADDPSLNFGEGNLPGGNLSIDAWIKTDDIGDVTILVDKRSIVGPSIQQIKGYLLFLSKGWLGFQLADGTATDYVSTAFVADGHWHHIAVTMDRFISPNDGKFYVDGYEVDHFIPTNHPGSLTNTSPLRMGRSSVSFIDGFYSGVLDEVELFPRVLTPEEIEHIFLFESNGKCKCVNRPPAMDAWWPLDEASGAIAYDIAPPPTNGTYLPSSNPPSPWPGMVAGARYFAESYVEVADDPSLNFGKGEDLTLDTWLWTVDKVGVKRLVDKRTVGTTVRGYSLFLRDGFLGFQLANGLGSGIDYISTALTAFVADGAWHHIAVSVDRTNDNLTGGKFYVDGYEVDQFDPTLQAGWLTNNSPLRLAVRSSSLNEYYRGALDEVELFHRVLTPGEIQLIAGRRSNGKCKPVPTPPCPTSEMVPVSADKFRMGCDPANNGGYPCESWELPLHSVWLDAYHIDKTEVTNCQYAQCVKYGPCTPPASDSSSTHQAYYSNTTYANYPVIHVTWYQAGTYCDWVGKGLPTEAWWERAARGVQIPTFVYPWGPPPSTCARANFWPYPALPCVGDTSAVGSYLPGVSPYGALNMAGNVWEWVNDWYDINYYSVSPGSNPPGPSTGIKKVLRGGSYSSAPDGVRTAQRFGYPPAYELEDGGFRCARSDTPTVTPTPTPTATATATRTPTPTPCSVPPPTAMTHWWPLDEQSGTIAHDIANPQTYGTHVNGPIPVPGMVAGALSFDGVNDYVEVAYNHSLDFGTGDLTLDAWIEIDPGIDYSNVMTLVDQRVETSNSGFVGYSLYLYNGKLGFQLAQGGGSWVCSPNPNAGSSCTNYGETYFVADGNWHYVAVTVDRNDQAGGKFYVDGSVVGVFDPTIRQGSLMNGNPLRLGSRSFLSFSGFYHGILDEVELFPRALDASEINGIFQAGSCGKDKSTPTPTPTATATATPTPTATHTPTPTVTWTPPSPCAAPEMVPIPDGPFQMGCDPANNGGYACQPWELPFHSVSLDAYHIDETEVTNCQYAQCVTAGECTAPADNSSSTHSSYYNNTTYANYPVTWVSWSQADAYCHWVGERLPTEAQWEKAARGVSFPTFAYPWGNGAPICAWANFYDFTTGTYCVGDTRAAGSYAPAGASPYGALDMAGNVFEWVNDWYDSSYYSVSPGSNPPGPGSGSEKVARGGSWGHDQGVARVAFRGKFAPDFAFYWLGFRCVSPP